jgi:hypothetical protein
MNNKDFKDIGLNCSAVGHLRIHALDNGEVILDKYNAIHPRNMGILFGRAVAKDNNGGIFQLCFGNGGTFLNSSLQIVYRAPNTVGNASLYNQTYAIQVDDQSSGTPPTNSVISVPSAAPSTATMIVVTAQLAAHEPPGQAMADNITFDPGSPYTFDEIGLKTADGLLLTHLILSPVEKTTNRAFLFTYTLTINVS